MAQRRYDGMQMGAFELLATKRAEIQAAIAEVDARREHWVARAGLERAVGRRLPVPSPAVPAPTAPAPSPAPPAPPPSHDHGGHR
jgi:outer membrane protein, heavy metal efflux system